MNASPHPRSTSTTSQDATAFATIEDTILRLGGAPLVFGPVGTGKSGLLDPLAVVTSNKADMLALRPTDDGQVL